VEYYTLYLSKVNRQNRGTNLEFT